MTDDGVPALSATNEFAVTVNEVNLPPVPAPVVDQTLSLGDTLQLGSRPPTPT